MATLVAANESVVLLNGTVIEGVRAIEYRHHQTRSGLYALGSAERIGVISGPQGVEGRLRVASADATLGGLTGDAPFQIVAQLRHGETQMTVTFDDCLLSEKSFALDASGHGETVYGFSAVRVREEVAAAAS